MALCLAEHRNKFIFTFAINQIQTLRFPILYWSRYSGLPMTDLINSRDNTLNTVINSVD